MSDYKINKQILEDSHELLVTVEAPQERVEKEIRLLAKKMGKRMNIPGFRPGKAPVQLIIARLGRDYLLQELTDELADEAFQEAFATVEPEEIAPGAELRSTTLEPLTYEFSLPLRPDVDAGDYRSIRVPVEEVDEARVDELVEKEIENFRSQNKLWKPVEGRPVQYGDLVTMGIKLTVDGKEELNQEEWDLVPSETDYTLTPEFDANIVGMAVGEKKTFTITFPDDGTTTWAGKEGVFEAEVKAIKAEELPELTDELVNENTEHETVDAFVQAMKEAARAQLERETETQFEEQLLEALKSGATLRFAPKTLAQEVERLEAEREDIYKSYGFETTEELLKLQGKTREQYLQELEPQAKSRLEEELLLDAVAEKEQLEVSDYELEKYIRDAGLEEEPMQNLLKRLKEDEYYRLYIRQLLLRKKAHKLLTAIAKGEDVPEPGQHPVEEAPEEPEEESAEGPEEVGSDVAEQAEKAEEEASDDQSEAEKETEEADEASE